MCTHATSYLQTGLSTITIGFILKETFTYSRHLALKLMIVIEKVSVSSCPSSFTCPTKRQSVCPNRTKLPKFASTFALKCNFGGSLCTGRSKQFPKSCTKILIWMKLIKRQRQVGFVHHLLHVPCRRCCSCCCCCCCGCHRSAVGLLLLLLSFS